MTTRMHVSSIQSVYARGVRLSVDPTGIDTVEAAVVPQGTAPDSGDYETATMFAITTPATGMWECDVRTHTIGGTGAQQVLTAGFYDVWLHLADSVWLDDMRFPCTASIEVWE